MKRSVIFLLFALVIFSSCRYTFGKRIYGNGHINTQTRSAGQFNSIDVSGSIDVYVKNDSAYGIKVETDENLQEYIQVVDDGDVLYIHTEEGFNIDATGRIKVYVSSPDFKRFEASGACNIYSENKITSTGKLEYDLSGSCGIKMDIKAPAVSADMSGACDIDLKGETKDLSIEGSGSTGISSMGLLAENVDVSISGAGDAEVCASVKLDVDVSGAGSVKYKGNAAVSQHVSGAGSVKKVE
ncbi:MAG: head GIN domain-containing protein [Bacteroidota bacterium]